MTRAVATRSLDDTKSGEGGTGARNAALLLAKAVLRDGFNCEGFDLP